MELKKIGLLMKELTSANNKADSRMRKIVKLEREQIELRRIINRMIREKDKAGSSIEQGLA